MFSTIHFPQLHKTVMNLIEITLYSKDLSVYLIIKYKFFELLTLTVCCQLGHCLGKDEISYILAF